MVLPHLLRQVADVIPREFLMLDFSAWLHRLRPGPSCWRFGGPSAVDDDEAALAEEVCSVGRARFRELVDPE